MSLDDRRSTLNEPWGGRWGPLPSGITIRQNAASIFALFGLGMALPLLDVFGRNPTFFVFKGTERFDIVLFCGLVGLTLPLCLILAELLLSSVHEAAGRTFHRLVVWLLSAAFALIATRLLGWNSATLIIGTALAVGALAVIAEQRHATTRRILRYLSPAPAVAIVLFAFFSPTANLPGNRGELPMAAVSIARPANIVMIVFDEFPLFPLLDKDGNINKQRFPIFFRLAQSASWFRNATSISVATQYSVGGILTGLHRPESAVPTASDYPRTLFTLLAGAYRMQVDERFTMYPASTCLGLSDRGGEGFGSNVSDAIVVYGHMVMPARWRSLLPSISNSWGNFAELPGQAADSSRRRDVGAGLDGPGRVRDLIDRVERGAKPTLYYTHTIFPHYPWDLSRRGVPYRPPPNSLGFAVDDSKGEVWNDNEFLVRQGLQRLMLELGHIDSLLGELIERLRSEGIWDETVLVIAADHGSSFEVGVPRRGPTSTNVDEQYRVPLFIKAPNQRDGDTRDDNVSVIDIVPTIVDLLEVKTDWTFDGRSLVGDTLPPTSRSLPFEDAPRNVSTSLEGLFALARRTAGWFESESWPGLFGTGSYGSLVGMRVEQFDARDASGTRWFINEEWA